MVFTQVSYFTFAIWSWNILTCHATTKLSRRMVNNVGKSAVHVNVLLMFVVTFYVICAEEGWTLECGKQDPEPEMRKVSGLHATPSPSFRYRWVYFRWNKWGDYISTLTNQKKGKTSCQARATSSSHLRIENVDKETGAQEWYCYKT